MGQLQIILYDKSKYIFKNKKYINVKLCIHIEDNWTLFCVKFHLNLNAWKEVALQQSYMNAKNMMPLAAGGHIGAQTLK